MHGHCCVIAAGWAALQAVRDIVTWQLTIVSGADPMAILCPIGAWSKGTTRNKSCVCVSNKNEGTPSWLVGWLVSVNTLAQAAHSQIIFWLCICPVDANCLRHVAASDQAICLSGCQTLKTLHMCCMASTFCMQVQCNKLPLQHGYSVKGCSGGKCGFQSAVPVT